MEKQLKVLFFVDYLFTGGIQTLVEDIVKYNDPSNMVVDFLTLDDGNKYDLQIKLEKQGVKIYQLHNTVLNSPLAFLFYVKKIFAFFKQHHDYDVVHLHTGSKNFFILAVAKLWRIPVRVAHSHNTGYQTKNKLSIFIGNIFKFFYSYFANLRLGCSKNACDWMFGTKVKTYPLPNAIDVKKFLFSSEIRNKIRDQLNVNDKLVFGHIGRLTEQKNHSFLLDVFSLYKERNRNFVLVLIGDGDLEDELKKKASVLGLTDNIMFLGYKKNQYEYLQAMDVFVFPSLFEGFGTVLIEAQTADLPVFSSNQVPQSVSFTNKIKFFDITDPQIWADSLPTCIEMSRKSIFDEVKEAGFEIETYINKLQKLYMATLNANTGC